MNKGSETARGDGVWGAGHPHSFTENTTSCLTGQNLLRQEVWNYGTSEQPADGGGREKVHLLYFPHLLSLTRYDPLCTPELCFLAPITAVEEARVSTCPDQSGWGEGSLSLPVTAMHGDSSVCAGGSGRGHSFTTRTTVWVVRAALARKQGKRARCIDINGLRRCALGH